MIFGVSGLWVKGGVSLLNEWPVYEDKIVSFYIKKWTQYIIIIIHCDHISD